jgi:adenosyl cobinamide kinase/adenosyl cobinamide phosphate guanylyltransferase
MKELDNVKPTGRETTIPFPVSQKAEKIDDTIDRAIRLAQESGKNVTVVHNEIGIVVSPNARSKEIRDIYQDKLSKKLSGVGQGKIEITSHPEHQKTR